jgi:hypothetical protein
VCPQTWIHSREFLIRRETERQRDRETKRQRDEETKRQRDKETKRQREKEIELKIKILSKAG